MMRWFRTCVFVTTLLVSASWLSEARAWYPYSDKYNQWQSTRPFNMTGWHNCVPRDHLDERIAEFQASGLNQLFWLKPIAARPFFEAASKAGLEWQCGMRGGPDAITEIMKVNGCSAVLVSDEPNTVGLKTDAERDAAFEKLRSDIAWVNANHPKVLAYANLSIAEIDLERYLSFCKPDVLSYDHYPLRFDGSTEQHFFDWMNMGREVARKHQLPYWSIIQAYGRAPSDGTAYRMPDEADQRFVAFTFLAHGGTGLGFFMYYGYPTDERGLSMVNDTGVKDVSRSPAVEHKYENTTPSPAYFAVRGMAPEIQNLAKALMKLRTKGDIGYAGVVPEKCKAFSPTGKLHKVEVLKESDQTALLSFFDDKAGEEYFMAVNLKHGAGLSQCDAAVTVRLTFDGSVDQIERLNRLTGRIETLKTEQSGNERFLDVQLPGGTGDLFKWSNGKPWDLRVEKSPAGAISQNEG